uniref:Tripartite motif containing 77 n=1 Tax=Suricata suricatta TaxID=37032 RepID=A0A673THH0_SURSU
MSLKAHDKLISSAFLSLLRDMDSNTFQQEFTCSLCVNYFIDPVTLGCGHSFCMPCLCILWEEAQCPPYCPVCKETSHQRDFKTNIILKTEVFLARRARPYDTLSSAEQMCEIHMKTKNFFCDVMKDQLCLLCCKSKEHEAHRHCSTDWIAEEYRQKLLKEMRSVWEKTQENQRNQKRESRKIRTWEGYVSLRREMIRSEYSKVHHLLYEEERRYLERIEQESKEILQQLKESEDNMDQMGKLLRGMYEDLKEMCHKPDLEMLQVKAEGRSSLQLHMPQPVDPQLSSWPITGLIERLTHFLVPMFFENETMTCHMPLFEDLRRWLFSCDHPDVVTSATRSKYFLAWGTQTFTGGQHYWEVDVGNCCNWALGFCDDSWMMKKDMELESEGVFLLFCIKEDKECCLFSSSPLSPQYVERPVGHVGVFLDYERGVVSFVNVVNSSLICSLFLGSFSLPLRPFVCSAPR